jgi:biotin operon repressor
VNNYSTPTSNTNKNEENFYKQNFTYHVSAEIFDDTILTINDLKIVMIVRSFTDTRRPSFMSNNWIAKRLKIDRRTVITCLNRLVEKGYLIREEIKGKRYLKINVPSIVEDFEEENLSTDNTNKVKEVVITRSPPRDLAITPPSDLAITLLDQTSITSKIIKRDFSKKVVDKTFRAPSERQKKEEFERCRKIGISAAAKAKEILGINNYNRVTSVEA